MPLTTDKVSICNQSLQLVGGARIFNPEENSEEAKICEVFFDSTLDEVICDNNWNCARAVESLPLTPPHPTHDNWQYRFSLPSDPYCLFVLREVNDEPFQIMGRYLLAEVSTVEIEYLKRVTVMAELSSDIKESFIYKLAAKICVPLEGDVQLSADLMSKYSMAIIQTKGRRSQEGDPRKTIPSGSWALARHRSSGRYYNRSY